LSKQDRPYVNTYVKTSLSFLRALPILPRRETFFFRYCRRQA